LLYKEITYKNSTILVWKIEETVEEIKSLIFDFLPDNDKIKFENFKTEQRQKEWLLSRFLLKKATNLPKEIYVKYDNFGKPFLDNFNISISHSKQFVAIIVSSNNSVAIDIQEISDKTKTVSHKFLSTEETNIFDINNSEVTSLLWSVKETAYKFYGKKNLPFIDGIKILPFDINNKEEISILINEKISVKAQYIFFDNSYLTFIVT
jgi:4'-phosphopantetheinyl transferase